MTLNYQVDIKIGSLKNIDKYKSLTINQEIASHHRVEIVVDAKDLEKISNKLTFESKKYLGEKINISIKSFDLRDISKISKSSKKSKSPDGLVFKGIITQIKSIKADNDGNMDEIIITASSPTVLLDDGPHFNSFSEVSLPALLDEASSPHQDKLTFEFTDLLHDSFVPYSVQNGESAFQYINRLAAQYGQWFYYDGSKLIFGKPQEEKIKLDKNTGLNSYSITLNPISSKYKFFSKDYSNNTILEGSADSSKSAAKGYNSFVNGKSADIYYNETKIWSNIGSNHKIQKVFDNNIAMQKKAFEINQVKISGVSYNPSIKLGNIIVIEGKKYRVIKIMHFNSNEFIYQNNFEAITADDNTYPLTNINAYPSSQVQSAIVVDNADPDNLGRIRVQFAWQEDGKKTPWIRISTPHAGGSKGFHFIPEIDEEVLIGFEGGNAERPYMMGSMYNGSAGINEQWSSKNNNIKAIRTRSGHTIQFNDTEGEESITIQDINSNSFFIDTANNSITISANETMTLNANNIEINANENMNLVVGKNKSENIGEDHTIQAKNSTRITDESEKSQAKESVKNAEKITINSTDENMELSSAKQVISNSAEKNILA